MRRRNDTKKVQIVSYINDHVRLHFVTPTVREISMGTGIPHATVHRYLVAMNEAEEIQYDGKYISTDFTDKLAPTNCVKVLGRVACGPGEDEQEQVLEYFRLPEKFVGKGQFFALIAKGDSMVDAGIHEGDYVIIRQTTEPELGDIVVALYDGKSNLKVLGYDDAKQQFFLRSCNADKIQFGDIYVDDLEVQGVAVGVYHQLGKLL